jgi:hypothetical protein
MPAIIYVLATLIMDPRATSWYRITTGLDRKPGHGCQLGNPEDVTVFQHGGLD